MALAAGARLGPYEILSALGAGGMGEVYRARDTKLNRDVAIKVLPDSLAADPERLARFEREAKTLAALNHPHIAHIHGFEDSTGTPALVLELVEGPTLADRIAKGPIPIDEALPIARQIAEALEAAHEQGIIHRDLKPANIKVRPDATVKVLDFGLAKALEPASGIGVDVSASPTLTSPAMTRTGVILGTAAYMSPEQTHGRATDRRTDIFSFGAVLFEMLSGRQAFNGESVSDTLASVLKVDPDWSQLPSATPPTIRRVLGRCLTKDLKRRLQAIGEARIVLENPVLEVDGPIARPTRPRSIPAWIAAAAFAAVAVGLALWGWLRVTPVEPRPVLRFVQTLDVANVPGGLALARDGSRLAFVSGSERSIYVRMMNQSDARPIPNTASASFLGFSPDGEWISFIAGELNSTASQLKKVAVTGGPVQRLASAPSGAGPPTQAWAADGNIYFDAAGTLQRISAEGGQPQTLATPDRKNNELFYAGPQLLPSAGDLLVSVFSGGLTARAVALNIRTGEKKILLDRAGLTQYVASRNASGAGHLLYYDGTSGSLLAVPFDARRLQVQGSPVPIVEGIEGHDGQFGKFGVSDAGMLAYARGAAAFASSTRMLVWVDRQGHEQATTAPIRRYNLPRLSPGGNLVAVEVQVGDPDAFRSDIWIYDVVRNTLTPVTSEDRNTSPVWTPDGKRLIYTSARSPSQTVLASAAADRSSPPSRVGAETESRLPGSVSRDGIVVGVYASATPAPAWTASLSVPSNEKPAAFLDSGSRKTAAVFSPDGHWIAYAADDSGRFEIYVTPYPGPGSRLPISTDGGRMPRWRSDGRELFFRGGDRTVFKMMAVDIDPGASLRAGTPKLLFEGDYGLNNGYDVAPDGERFLMLKPSSSAQPMPNNQVTFVVNWFTELQQRVPTK